ncbi:vitellogenin receptor [Trichonephila clavipes]|nr:vitellogenin receptor [Trichonephila clavipes]
MSEHQLCRRLGNSTFQCTDNLASCKTGEWRCENGLCIDSKLRCNGRVDCYDMSDELDCECGDGMFRCGNSTPCLPEKLRCNGHIDCWDASDEVNCTKSCGDNKFTCNDGHCIQMSLFCDRFPDCQDGSDEPEGCSESCLQTQKQCHNGRCVGLSLWCNGHDDCKDGSDEMGCT